MNGMLLVDKPPEWTSFDVVNYTRAIVARSEGKKPKQVKVGHTGTLDPLATGLLVVLIGDYTKRAPALTKLDKTYKVAMRLGETSTTGDAEGEKSFISDRQASLAEVETVLRSFVGEQAQIPPAYSAKKVNGQRAYALARAGKVVKLEPQIITIYSLTLESYNYPVVTFTAKVSSGTYIRSLTEDIGQALQSGGYMSALRRTQIGPYNIDTAAAVKQLDIEQIKHRLLV